MLQKSDLGRLLDYTVWANHRVVRTAATLTIDEFRRDLGGSYGGVRGTLAHILAAEWIWLERWNGVSPRALLDTTEFPTVESLRTRWEKIEEDCLDFLKGVTDESLARVIAYTNTKGEEWAYPLGRMLQHVMNHSSYHRGQVVTMLRQLGAEVTPVDLLVFMDVKAG